MAHSPENSLTKIQELSIGAEARIFIGFPIHSNLKAELEKSHLWKEALITKNPGELIEIFFNEKRYVGVYAKGSYLTLKQIDEETEKIINRIQELCPKVHLDQETVAILSQVFLS
ncbi:hypothetical protein [Criblamydia sequanensis]|uniref:Uncharacterized protein n=1 Tax=Candidatus Criblamydia sequanensis CRIB-18 TaxID=1437425 RepID=A0A090D357_9BACT|nr:hypothetical protein [Criblamydia sequanensis]CDR35205.1 hypothetical protein CSEC_2399 [Criblamydia sequanensis CRIB-18]